VANTRVLFSGTNAGIVDNAMQNILETVSGVKTSTAQSKFGGSSMYFDGTGDYITILPTPLWNFSSGNWTVETWIYFNSVSTAQVIFNYGYDAGATNRSFISYGKFICRYGR
jgi:hypothetical protein